MRIHLQLYYQTDTNRQGFGQEHKQGQAQVETGGKQTESVHRQRFETGGLTIRVQVAGRIQGRRQGSVEINSPVGNNRQ